MIFQSCMFRTTIHHALFILIGTASLPSAAFCQHTPVNWRDFQVSAFTWRKGENIPEILARQKEALTAENVPFRFVWLAEKTNATVTIVGCLTNVSLGEVMPKMLAEEMLYSISVSNTLFVLDRDDYGDTCSQKTICGKIRKKEGVVRNVSVLALDGTNRPKRVNTVVDVNGKFMCLVTYRSVMRYIRLGGKKFFAEEHIEAADRITALHFAADGCVPFIYDVSKFGMPDSELEITLEAQ